MPGSMPGLPDRVDFNFHIKPILSDRCFTCHGPDKAQVASGLQLNDSALAFLNLAETGEPNRFALVPGSPETSEVVRRITSDSLDVRMPPVSSHRKPLTEYEQQLIIQWIAQGAEYKAHWAYIPPEKRPLPPVKDRDWSRQDMDAFILAQLEAKGLTPAPEADPETLIRRVYFDLTGLPPTPTQVDAFIQDADPDAYERLVDHLLSRPQYGERLAMEWLDVARYADTHAIHVDMARTSWPWRDWVIAAFNENKPYDRFIVEQLAGDLLPDATLAQRIATSFNRHHGISNEGGAIDEELRIEYAADRVRTVGTAFMGLTLNCARCHDHKYDPVSMDDYYSMMSFFNSVDQEKGLEVQNEYTAFAYRPYVEVWEPNDRLEFDRNERLLKEIDAKSQWNDTFEATFKSDPAVTPLTWIELLAKGESPAPEGGAKSKIWDIRISNKQDIFERLRDPNVSQDFSFVLTLPAHTDPLNVIRIEIPKLHPLDDLSMAYAFVPALVRSLTIEVPGNITLKDTQEEIPWVPKHVAWSWAPEWNTAGDVNYKQALDHDPNTLWEVAPTDRPFTLFMMLDEPIVPSDKAGKVRVTWTFMRGGTHCPQQADVFAASCMEGVGRIHRLAPFSPLASIPVAQLADWQKRSLVLDSLRASGQVEPGFHEAWWLAQDRQFGLQKHVVRCMVMKEMAEPRPTYVLSRGQYDQPDKTRPRGRAVPAVFGTLPEGASEDRLGLAQWLVDPNNPLVSRVTVNRYWQLIFGTGLVKTAEDFGAQGEVPSHPALLDTLAVDFVKSGWDLKRLMKTLVTSATYRQQAGSTAESQRLDPENRLLSHYPRRRLQAEMIRDSALAASGLLVAKIGGPSVKPYQPDGLWRERAMRKTNSTGSFLRDSGPGLYRRGMYTFWKQAAPPPQMATFDAPPREVCMVRRSLTNTPLQALILQNDETYLEIARKVAERVMQEIPGQWEPALDDRVTRAFRLLTGRRPAAHEVQILRELAQTNLDAFSGEERLDEVGKTLLQYGDSAVDNRLPPVELASLAFTVSAILNLDETITQD
ncbi:MAG: PSD1 and planctomycete cytochrome C domain-containing protein [Phycisphaerae bacterium]|nr:PSD1 and planctomycete cytochrome C domain-containing protein [Phycisphaerae bacterium]